MTRPQTQDEEYHWIYFFGTRGAPAGRGFDRQLPNQSTLLLSSQRGWRVFWLTGQDEEGRLLGAGINLVFLPFYIALIERELGPTDEEVTLTLS
jgi:hypothetical protein